MRSSRTTRKGPRADALALADALTAGLALGYLADENRATIAAHLGLVSLVTLVALAAAVALGAVIRTLNRAASRVETILLDELPRREP
jgi:hypothetical protein